MTASLAGYVVGALIGLAGYTSGLIAGFLIWGL